MSGTESGFLSDITKLAPTIEDVLRVDEGLLDRLRGFGINPDDIIQSIRHRLPSLRELLKLIPETDEVIVGNLVAEHIANWIATKEGTRTRERLDPAIWSAIGLPYLKKKIETIDATGLTSETPKPPPNPRRPSFV